MGTNRNLSFKNHRNGIKLPKNWRLKCKSVKARGFRGVDREFRRDFKQSRLGTKRALWAKIMSKRDKRAHQRKLRKEPNKPESNRAKKRREFLERLAKKQE